MKTIILAIGMTMAGAAGAESHCEFSLTANQHASGDEAPNTYLSIDLRRSEYRIDKGAWRAFGELCRAERLEIAPGETAALSCRSDASCGRYRLLLRIDSRSAAGELITTRFVAFPLQAEFVELNRSVNLGDLNELLAAAALSGGPQRRAAHLFD